MNFDFSKKIKQNLKYMNIYNQVYEHIPLFAIYEYFPLLKWIVTICLDDIDCNNILY